jgi:hypothetical protein
MLFLLPVILIAFSVIIQSLLELKLASFIDIRQTTGADALSVAF